MTSKSPRQSQLILTGGFWELELKKVIFASPAKTHPMGAEEEDSTMGEQ